MVTISFPLFSGRLATCIAAQTFAPVEMPTIPAELSLGDVARAYRQQKQLQHFFDSQQWAQFHLPVSNAPLAAPKPPVLGGLRAPANPVVIVLPAVRPPMDPTTTIHPTRRSPFARPVMGPAIRPRLVAPPVVKSEPAEIAKPAPEPIAKLNPTAAAKLAPAPFAVASVVPKSVAPVEPRVAVPAGSSVRLVIVQRGDSLWKLAQQNLGGGLRWHELLAANPSVVDPQRLGVGTKLVVPAATVSMPTSSRIIVRKGDTLWALAQTHLGRATSWTCIAQANPMVPDPQRIFVGQELLLPASCTP